MVARLDAETSRVEKQGMSGYGVGQEESLGVCRFGVGLDDKSGCLTVWNWARWGQV